MSIMKKLSDESGELYVTGYNTTSNETNDKRQRTVNIKHSM